MKNQTKVVLLGTGTPNPVPERSGPCVAVVVNDQSYLVDFGPGLVRQAQKAYRMGIDGLQARKLTRAFLTHLHSDHTVGYADLIYTPWVMTRDQPLQVFGPKGLKKMTEHILAAYEVDIHARKYGLEKANQEGIEVVANEISEGLIYKDDLVSVEAFLVDHPPFESYGYKFTTPDKIVVISGDTCPCDNLVKHAKECDILVHEVYSSQGIKGRTPQWQKYHTRVHTSSYDLGKIASEVQPGLLVLYHQLFMVTRDEATDESAIKKRTHEMIDEIKVHFTGHVVSGNDMDVFD
ncbi:MBL fold metallo-hydrolase [Acidaminobacter sp. JC074]|uniref:MBL fold metallo-hydrolase n=1 Tax=Acidaminobacter sp. JC074 TaxID=2530199 RepID=UPI001F0EF41F|nr:MBL fold metallo-hydrolase [Acidaminobacter sp. JC074]MCH4889952.1 MBL fold metallo-hydrolase [Acidaminobacter sp. JC074]